jgi:hypothetical protein
VPFSECYGYDRFSSVTEGRLNSQKRSRTWEGASICLKPYTSAPKGPSVVGGGGGFPNLRAPTLRRPRAF